MFFVASQTRTSGQARRPRRRHATVDTDRARTLDPNGTAHALGSPRHGHGQGHGASPRARRQRHRRDTRASSRRNTRHLGTHGIGKGKHEADKHRTVQCPGPSVLAPSAARRVPLPSHHTHTTLSMHAHKLTHSHSVGHGGGRHLNSSRSLRGRLLHRSRSSLLLNRSRNLRGRRRRQQPLPPLRRRRGQGRGRLRHKLHAAAHV